MTTRDPRLPSPADLAVELEMRRRTRRAFLIAALAAGAGIGGWSWLKSRPMDAEGIVSPVRRMLEFNEKASRKIFSPNRKIIELPASAITPGGPRINGDIGLEEDIDIPSWSLAIAGTALAFTLAELQTLPAVSQITPLNCIEGWTNVASWTGVRFSDFADKFYPAGRKKPFVGLSTPDAAYYVGLDAPSAFHSQTLLCYAINGKPLTQLHGAPLRLLIPTKYGIKNLKRVARIEFSDTRPHDYWAEAGYDWFAGF